MNNENGYDCLTQSEQVDLAVDLDNLEELLRVSSWATEQRALEAQVYIETLRKWVDRLCR
jgi:hypothetical protein